MKQQLIMGVVAAFLSLCPGGRGAAQTTADAQAVACARWDTLKNAEGMVCRQMKVANLYGGTQSVSVIEADPAKGWKGAIAVGQMLTATSRLAEQAGAEAAVNGTYFNMKKGGAVCLLKTAGRVRDTTSLQELRRRTTGAVRITHGRLKLVPWDRRRELSARRRGEADYLASGPLLVSRGKTCDWSTCDSAFVYTKHPRSAVALTRKGKILLVAVDGRNAVHAAGVNLPELAHLLHLLGASEALNLDGGGSTTLWLKGEGVVNYPSDNKRYDHAGERKVDNILYLTR